jgi:ADP-heptose:LPS heptosyltransferase
LTYRKKREIFNKQNIKKMLLYRLDQKIGNCLMLIPLIKAIKMSRPDIKLHVLIFYPVADLLQNFLVTEVEFVWPYQQQHLLHHPFRFIGWLFQFRKEEYDLIISSHNPDNFSISQALFGLWCSPKLFVGFDWQISADFYDITVKSSINKHYCEAQLDLWRFFYPTVCANFGGLTVQKDHSNVYVEKKNDVCFLLWLGTTGNKKLPPHLIIFLYEKINDLFGKYPLLAIGAADTHIMANLPQKIIDKIIVWDKPLLQTAKFFSKFHLFISGDTGPMHLAVALGLPTLVLFINSNIKQYGYQDGTKHFALNFSARKEDYSEIESDLLNLKKYLLGN